MNSSDQTSDKADLYARFPKPGETKEGLKWNALQRLADDGFIEVLTIKRPGRSRGYKLIYLPSLYQYLERLRTKGRPAVNQAPIPQKPKKASSHELHVRKTPDRQRRPIPGNLHPR
jgi:hypothetical protein